MKYSFKSLLFIIICFCLLLNIKAQTSTISGVINNYASVSTIAAQSITVPSSTGFIVGDKVLLIQMKGATIDVTNNSSFGTINSYNDAGNYEMLFISAVSSNTITFITPILKTYNAVGLVQLVKVPVYNNVNVTGVLTCLPWNGLTGGVLVFEATGNVTLNANIDVTGKGFLGGAKVAGQFLSCTGNSTDFKLPSTSLLSGNKGEGIALINTSYTKGLGALANGGGAGNDVNGGGAGGGNYGMGGHGGNCKCSGSPIALCGGYEGKNCVYSNASNKIFLGGGGGSGHENDGVSTAGVSGGGIVIIRSGGTILGNGNFINANGSDNNMIAGNDGQGGGGAGGAVLLDVCSTSSLNISVKGGKGGTDNFTGPDCHGKGGGGGGGVIWTSSNFPYTSFLTGGNPGVFTNSASQCFNTSNGATTGQIGGTLSGLLIPGATSLSSVNGFTINTSSVCIGSSGTAIATLSTSAFSPTVSFTLINSVGTVVSQTNNTSSLTNSVTNLPNGIYTYSVQMNTSCGLISNTQTVNINCTTSSVPPCKGVLTGTGMSICNQYSFSITPSQTITPLNYGNQGYACTGATMPDVSFNIMGAGWRVMKNNWFFESSVAGEITGFDNMGVLQTIPFSATNTITPLSYSGSFVQFAINGVAAGALLNQTTFSISLNSSLHTSNNYTYCPSSSASVSISPIIPAQGGPWTYTWQPGGLTGNPINVSPSSTNIYTVSATSSAGCLSTTTVSVSVIPNATVSISGNTLICLGETTSLTASGASSYSWNPGGSVTSITITPNTTTNYSVVSTGSVCSNTTVATVSVVPNPTLTLSPNTSICTGANNSVTLTASGASTYTWANASSLSSSTGSVVTASPNTTTNYTVTGANSLCTNTAIVTVSVNPSPSITSTLVTNTSCGLSNGSATITSLPTNNTYTWSSGIISTTNSASSLAAGNYTVTAINGACQTSTVINILGSSLLQIVSNTVSPTNCGVNNGQIIVTDNYTNSTYSWSPITSTTNTLTNLATGNYTLTITNGACATSSIFTVSQLSGPTSLNVNQHNAICESSNGSLTITSVINGASPYQYAFNNSGYSSVITYSNLSQGVYTITVKDVYGCIYSQDYIITKVIEHSQIEFTANRPTCNSNDGSFIVNSINGGTTPYLLNFNNTLYSSNTIFEQIGIGDYSLTILDSNLCESSFVLSMPLDKSDYTLYVPNTFTPNNDTRNDFWFAKGTCLNAFNCLIFNRWGEKIIELKDINEYWDGTYKGKSVPEGVYVYLIEAETNDGTIYKNGHITLFR